MLRIYRFLIILGVVIITILPVYSAKTNKPKTEKNIKFYTQSFDISLDKLPPNFMGHDIKTIYEALEKIDSPGEKGEFETTEDYKTRLIKYKESLSTLFQKQLAFKSEAFDSQYDADKQTLAITLANHRAITTFAELDELYYKEKIDESFIQITRVIKNSEYMASNAFGETKKVYKHQEYEYGLRLGGNFEEKINQLKRIDLNINATDAKKLKPNLGMLLICRIMPASIDGKEYFSCIYANKHEPKMNNPWDLFFWGNYIFVEINGLWIYDTSSGKIYKKLEVDNGIQ